ncbi:hypothetical protein A4X13_0g9082 [Tilletia indica]|uniref:Uncharacterized protein n=1 Tax=Tilletia indica TaxID=43049 RepID=A0A177SZ98_9BASI|nr:hypothetical protein A4X13_0g9082 [Tilletia indica]
MTEPRPDALLYIEDREVCQRAIEWRANKLCIRSTCSACKGKFKRACVDRCAEGYNCPIDAADQRLMARDIVASDEVLTAKRYLRPDAYLNNKRYKKFRKLVVHIDRLNRSTGTADQAKASGGRDLSRKEIAQNLARERHAPDVLDISMEAEWIDPEDQPPRATMIWHKAPAASIEAGPSALVADPEPHPADPPGGLTKTFVIGGEQLPNGNTVEQYACLSSHLLMGYLRKESDQLEYTRRSLSIPRCGIRLAILEELRRRARGQGLPNHAPERGFRYDPSKPYVEV